MTFTYGLSLTGLSHKDTGASCQDAHQIVRLPNRWILAAVADGVGSSANADVASKLAVATAAKFIQDNLPSKWNNDNLKALIQVGFYKASEAVAEEAEKNSCELSDYETTLTLFINNGGTIVYGHVGDGGIIGLTHSGDYVPVTSVQKGEEYNVVVPLSAGASKWIIDDSEEEFCSLLLLTDGLLDVMQPPLLKGDIYVRFAQQFMDNGIMNITETTADDVENAIHDFLESESCRSITDDKTIVGIVNTDVVPARKGEDYYQEPDWEQLRNEQDRKLYPYLYDEQSRDL